MTDCSEPAGTRRRDFLRQVAAAPLLLSGTAGLLAACDQKPAGGTVLTVGSTATGVPFTFLDPSTNQLTGAMVDIARAVAKGAGMTIDPQVVTFGALIPSLTSKKIDVIAAAMARTEERAKIVDFTDLLFTYGTGVVVPTADTRSYPTLAALKGMPVGAQVGTRFVRQLEEAGAEVKTYDSLSDVLRDVGNGRIAAGYGDAPIFAYHLGRQKDAPIRQVKDFTPPSLEETCLVIAKGQPALLAQLNKSIAGLQGAPMEEILVRWGIR